MVTLMERLIWREISVTIIHNDRGGQVVAVLAFYSGDPSLDPAEVHNFYIIQIAWKEWK